MLKPNPRPVALACLMWFSQAVLPAQAATPTDSMSELRQQIDELRQQYEARLQALELRVQQAEQQAQQAHQARAAAPADASTASVAPEASPAPAASAGNAFNPQVSLILSGTYANLQRDPRTWAITGFAPGGDIGPGNRGFNLGESELGLYANVDPWFYGGLNLSVAGDNTVSAEEAFIQTTALPDGVRVKVGRFFSGIGYLNEQHAHTWDFVDAPLAYQAFLGTQFGQEGAQVKWLLPTDRFVELGAELGNGASFPGSDRNRNGAGAAAMYAHTGGDWGDSSSWRAGVSYLWAHPKDRSWDDTSLSGSAVNHAFTGDSRLWMLDGVWKWSPNGNATHTNFKLQGEYFRRTEKGDFTYDTSGAANTDAYRSAQSGWYVQGIYQFMPTWRVGLRQDMLDAGTVDYASNNASLARSNFSPRRTSVMLDWSLSEFSRWRLQLARDHAREDSGDTQLFLQYQMSLGAHGAHSY